MTLTPTQGVGKELLEFKAGGGTQQDLHVSLALWTATNHHLYPQITYPPLTPDIERYARDRCNGDAEYNQTLSKDLGLWLYRVVRNRDTNEANLSLFRWCLKVLGKHDGLEREIQRRKEAYGVADKVDLACGATQLDGMERAQRSRGRGE